MRNEKQFLVKEISEKIGSADYVYFVSFAGLKVKELEDLRKQLAAQSRLLPRVEEHADQEGLRTLEHQRRGFHRFHPGHRDGVRQG